MICRHMSVSLKHSVKNVVYFEAMCEHSHLLMTNGVRVMNDISTQQRVDFNEFDLQNDSLMYKLTLKISDTMMTLTLYR